MRGADAGPALEPRTYRVTREALAAYAAASGDHNPIHQHDDVALAVGLPGVIAHGMFTLALAARFVEEQGGAGRVATIGAKFAKPVVVPAEGTDLHVEGAWDLRDGVRSFGLEVTCDGVPVLRGCRGTLRD